MKDFELRKSQSDGEDAGPGEIVMRGSLEDIVEFAATNGMTWNQSPNHQLGACFIKVIGPDAVETYELAPTSTASAADGNETALSPINLEENEFAIRAKMAEVIEYAQQNALQFRKLIKNEPAARSFAWWALSQREEEE